MGEGNGTFLKIERDHILENGNLISISKEVSILVQLEEEEREGAPQVDEKLFNEEKHYSLSKLEPKKIQLNILSSAGTHANSGSYAQFRST